LPQLRIDDESNGCNVTFAKYILLPILQFVEPGTAFEILMRMRQQKKINEIKEIYLYFHSFEQLLQQKSPLE
jgi:hypothetical protein